MVVVSRRALLRGSSLGGCLALTEGQVSGVPWRLSAKDVRGLLYLFISFFLSQDYVYGSSSAVYYNHGLSQERLCPRHNRCILLRFLALRF